MTKLTILISLILLFGPFPSTGRPGVKDENYNKKKEEMRKNYLPTFESGEESEVSVAKCCSASAATLTVILTNTYLSTLIIMTRWGSANNTLERWRRSTTAVTLPTLDPRKSQRTKEVNLKRTHICFLNLM